MNPISVQKKNGNLIITCPISKELPLSNSGKGRLICSTHGNVPVDITIDNKHKKSDNNVILSVNCYVRATDKEAIEHQAVVKEAMAKAKNG